MHQDQAESYWTVFVHLKTGLVCTGNNSLYTSHDGMSNSSVRQGNAALDFAACMSGRMNSAKFRDSVAHPGEHR